MDQFYKVATLDEIGPGEGKTVMAGEREIAIFNVGGKIYATANTCPHRGGPLGEGGLEGEVISCPWHGWQFNVKTGESQVNPDVKIDQYTVKINGNDILVQTQ